MAFRESSLFSFKDPKWLQSSMFGYKVDGESLVNVWKYLTDITVRQYSDCHLLLSYADDLFPAFLHIFDKYPLKRFKPPDFVIHDLLHWNKLLRKMFWNNMATSIQKQASSCFSYPCCFQLLIDYIKNLLIVDPFQNSKNVKSNIDQICTISDQIQNWENVSFFDLNSFMMEFTKTEKMNKEFLEYIVRNQSLISNEQYDKSCSKEENTINVAHLLQRDIFSLSSLHMMCPILGMCLFFVALVQILWVIL